MRANTVKYLSTLHTAAYRATGGLIGRRLVGNDMCLLTTTGRRSGKPHTVPLLYLEDGGRFVVIASYGGRYYHPDWYHNLLADPRGILQVLQEQTPVTARIADATERDKWWPRVVEAYHDYATYQSRTDREIPIVFLEPRNSSRSS